MKTEYWNNVPHTCGDEPVAGSSPALAITKERNESKVKTDYLMQFFKYQHLQPYLQAVSKPFGEMAQFITETLPANPERTTALRKLLEAKDCAVRAFLFKEEEEDC